MIRSRLHPGIRNEEGLVSFLIVSVIIALLALVTVGFSRIMGREVRQALDRELTAQAYYSAESGINDARAYLAAGGTGSPGCAPPTSPFFVNSGDISGDGIAKYSCVVLDATPKELIYNLKAGESAIFKLKIPSMANLYLSWENLAYPGAPRPLGIPWVLPREDLLDVNDTGLLRVGLYPTPPGNAPVSNANDDLTARSRNYFMYPNAAAGAPGSVAYSSVPANGSFVRGNCHTPRTLPPTGYQSTPRYCNSVITNLQGSNDSYYVRLTAVYAPLSISVQATNGGGIPQTIPNVEGVIDVTGTGNDVLRRLRVRVPLQNISCSNSNWCGFGIQSMETVCKLFRVPVPSLGSYSTASVADPTGNTDNACTAPTGP